MSKTKEADETYRETEEEARRVYEEDIIDEKTEKKIKEVCDEAKKIYKESVKKAKQAYAKAKKKAAG